MESFKPLFAGLGIVVFLVGGLGLAMYTITRPTQWPAEALMLMPTQGESEYEAEGELVWQSVHEAREIDEGGVIRVPSGSTADVWLYDQGVMHLAAETVVVVETAQQEAQNPESVSLEFSLQHGTAWVNFASLENETRSLRLRTSSSQLESHGGTFILAVDSASRSSVYVAEGGVIFGGLTGEEGVELEEASFAALEEGNVRVDSLQEGDFATSYREADEMYFTQVHAKQLDVFKEQRKIDPESSLYVFRRFTEQLWLRSTRQPDERAELLARFVTGRLIDAYIEELEHADRLRAQILVSHAEAMATEEVWQDPEVQRARNLFYWLDAKVSE